jgi:hypothetical protein
VVVVGAEILECEGTVSVSRDDAGVLAALQADDGSPGRGASGGVDDLTGNASGCTPLVYLQNGGVTCLRECGGNRCRDDSCSKNVSRTGSSPLKARDSGGRLSRQASCRGEFWHGR